MCAGVAPASATTATTFLSACADCSTKSSLSNCWFAFQPIWPPV